MSIQYFFFHYSYKAPFHSARMSRKRSCTKAANSSNNNSTSGVHCVILACLSHKLSLESAFFALETSNFIEIHDDKNGRIRFKKNKIRSFFCYFRIKMTSK